MRTKLGIVPPVNGAFAALLLLLAGWPTVRWYALRLTDGSDEPLGLLPLLAALVLLPRAAWRAPVSTARLWIVGSGLVTLTALAPWLPPLARALVWVGLLVCALTRSPAVGGESGDARRTRAGWVGWATLLVLSLPLVSTVQFYLGFPLRAMTTQLAAAVLRCGGLEVAAQGTVLTWRGERVLIDAPCSGVHMLWTLLCVGALLAAVSHAGPRETLRLFRRASLLVLVANTLRAAALFCVELRLWPSPPWAHDAIGLTLFGAAAAALVAWTMRRDRKDSNAEHVPVRAAFEPCVPSTRIRWVWVLTCGACAVWPVLVDPGAARSRPVDTKDFPGWAAAPLPAHLHGVPLGPSEKRFAENFPGAIGAFRDDSQRTTWIVRWVAQPTRKLHPAIDCLRALGFSIEPGAGSQDAMGRLWGGASATKPGGQRLRVREQISDSRGRTWSDVSAWYWSAFWRQTEGPWWALTQLEES